MPLRVTVCNPVCIKAPVLMCEIVLGRVICFKLGLPAKACSLISKSSAGNFISVRLASAKANFSISFTESGISIWVRWLQPSKVLRAIVLKLGFWGRVTVVSEVQPSKAFSSIFSIVLGRVILTIGVPLNASLPTTVIRFSAGCVLRLRVVVAVSSHLSRVSLSSLSW